MAEPTPHIDADDTFDGDSAVSVPTRSDLTSLSSSVLDFKEENGRTYHSMSSGKYAWPNDDAENDRLDLQHQLWLLTLRGKLLLCPKAEEAKRVLDCGTGTGIWALDFADAHPEAEVIGVDLSPIQPSMVPPNLTFQTDDLEKEWTWHEPFDLIFARVLAGSLVNFQEFIQKSFDALEPGGYLEMHDFWVPYESDDDTLSKELELWKLSDLLREACNKAGRPLDLAPQYGEMMRKVGFEDVTESRYKWPTNTWPKDKHYKELGMWNLANVDGGLEGLVIAPFTRILGWSKEETLVFCSKVRKQLRDPKIHCYVPILVVYGRKPKAEEAK